jgi:hypothetical protein
MSAKRVELHFEDEPKSETYKQLIKRTDGETREFGHGALRLTELRLIIMASDIKDHPAFGVDTQYWVTFNGKSQITIDGLTGRSGRYAEPSTTQDCHLTRTL